MNSSVKSKEAKLVFKSIVFSFSCVSTVQPEAVLPDYGFLTPFAVTVKVFPPPAVNSAIFRILRAFNEVVNASSVEGAEGESEDANVGVGVDKTKE